MEKFPYLRNNQVALLKAERGTGHIIDENFQLAVSNLQKVFIVFDNVDIALQAAKGFIISNNEIEIILYGKNKVVLYFITIENVNQV